MTASVAALAALASFLLRLPLLPSLGIFGAVCMLLRGVQAEAKEQAVLVPEEEAG